MNKTIFKIGIGLIGILFVLCSCCHHSMDTTLKKHCNKAWEFTYILDDKGDHWQTPLETEIRQGGDCEDQSLWLYDKLKHAGHDVIFVVGKIHKKSKQYHAWVELNFKGKVYVLDPTASRCISIKRFKNRYISMPNLHFDIKFRKWKIRLNQ